MSTTYNNTEHNNWIHINYNNILSSIICSANIRHLIIQCWYYALNLLHKYINRYESRFNLFGLVSNSI